MSGAVKDGPDTIHVAVKSLTDRQGFDVGADCTVRQLKRGLSGRMGASAEQLVLVHSGRVLRDSEVLSHLKGLDRSVSVYVTRRPASALPISDSASGTARSALTAGVGRDVVAASPTAPLGLGLDPLPDSGSGVFPALRHQMERQLLADPQMMCSVLGSPLVQSTLSSSSPQLARQLILSNPQIQQLLETNPDVGDMLNSRDVIRRVLELIRNPDMIEVTGHGLGLTDLYGAAPLGTTASGEPAGARGQTLAFSCHPTDPLGELTATPRAGARPQLTVTAGMQSLLEEVVASPGLMESLLSGPYVRSLLNCLSQNPDLAAQMLLSHPLFSGDPQLQQEMKQHLPLFLQQMQNPELLTALLNPKAMEAVLQIQQGLQTLAAEAPALVPMTGHTNSGTSVTTGPQLASNTVPNSQSGNDPHVATVTEQQQKFVQQMLKALATTSNGVHSEEAGLHEELEQMSSMGFGDRQANRQALISSGGDLTAAIQRLLGL